MNAHYRVTVNATLVDLPRYARLVRGRVDAVPAVETILDIEVPSSLTGEFECWLEAHGNVIQYEDEREAYSCDSCGAGPFHTVSASSGPEPEHDAGWECPACGAFNCDDEGDEGDEG
jgi:hypothetical protein